MKRIVAKILCTGLVLVYASLALVGQDRALRIGFQTSPLISWIGNNDNLIIKNGSNFGIKLGSTVDIYFRDNYSFTTGINLAFHEGGEFQYEIGGNYLPESDLSDPLLQVGDKPLPDGTRIRYSLQYVEIPLGLKIRSKEIGYVRYFVEAPVFHFDFLTRGRANIETDIMKYNQENIYKDLSVVNIFWGFGAGIEYSISENNALVGGLYYQNGLLDFTRDNGERAIANPDEDPNDPNDNFLKQKDDSRAVVNNLVLRLGIIF
ncbi:MAG: porin family protein [Saprospiraceae bacterium]